MKFVETMIEYDRKHYSGIGGADFEEVKISDDLSMFQKAILVNATVPAYDLNEIYSKNSLDNLNHYCFSSMFIGSTQEFRDKLISEVPEISTLQLIKLDLANMKFEEVFKKDGDDFVYLPTDKSILPEGKEGYILYLENFLLADNESKYALSEIAKHSCFPQEFNTRLHPKCAFIAASDNEESKKCTNTHLDFTSYHVICSRFGSRFYFTDN